MKKEKFIVSESLIGKYINQYLWSDVNPVGKIVGVKGKTKVIIQPVVASEMRRLLIGTTITTSKQGPFGAFFIFKKVGLK